MSGLGGRPQATVAEPGADAERERRLRVVGQLAGGIAHDFNNLLTAILGAADAILGRTETPADTVADAQQIRRGVERGAALVRQLLAFSRQQTLQPRIVAVNAAIEDAARLLRRLLGAKIALTVTLEQPGRRVMVDPGQLDQVLLNLAVNARDAMAEGGTLTLASGHATLYRARLAGAEIIPPGRYVTITVADSGVGIAEAVMPRIFEPFFTTKRAPGASGLGGTGQGGTGQGGYRPRGYRAGPAHGAGDRASVGRLPGGGKPGWGRYHNGGVSAALCGAGGGFRVASSICAGGNRRWRPRRAGGGGRGVGPAGAGPRADPGRMAGAGSGDGRGGAGDAAKPG